MNTHRVLKITNSKASKSLLENTALIMDTKKGT